MSARDLAATVPLTERLMATATEYARAAPYGQPLVVGLLREAASALAALERRAADAQSNLDGMAQRIKADEASHCQAERRAVAAEALAERYRGGLANVLASAGVPEYVRQNVEHYLAAAGADTP